MSTMKANSLWPARISWPGGQRGASPTLAPLSYVRGEPRFTIAPLSLSLDQLLFLITAALLSIGLIMVQSAEARIRDLPTNDNWLLRALLTKNLIHAGIALAAMTLIWRLDYRRLLGKTLVRSPALYLVALTVLLLGLTLTTPLGKEILGAKRWFALGPIGFQPSELAKLGMVSFVAAYAVHRSDRITSLLQGYLPILAVLGLVVALIIKEDFGTAVLVVGIGLIMLLMAGCRWWHVAMLLPPAAFGAYHMLFHSAFRHARLMAFMHPDLDPKGAGYHPMQSLLTIMHGGTWGVGLGNGVQKMGFLPEASSDFIFAVVCEELGLFGAIIVLALFAMFVLAGWRVAWRCESLFGKMLAFGITATIGLQAAINIAVVVVVVPTKGIALPLISSGGTGWIMMAVAIGVLMSIERVNRLEAFEASQHPTTHPGEDAYGFPVELATKTEPETQKADPV